ncbi:hypothetical protein C0J08_03655 [Marinomonas sp. CT5]|uniref:NAD-dependent epimerase/dehydratase family protein n=1 Tax=Marinomonas sp. CT5 TaxID=2066133 RepID=UPI001BAF3BD2|nr:NAD-dependent epimerase/dehydratase family protein [Marinomonas sp. CT5]QUX94561.1 hypothetical protein C0J08_03655 [Marinomonas sp. CT5]
MIDRYLVLGGAGFIGKRIVSELCALGKDVTSVSLHLPEKRDMVKEAYYLSLDLTVEEDVITLFSNSYQYVINAMGYVNHSKFKKGGFQVVSAHLLSTINQLRYIDTGALKKYLYIGSADEYPQSLTPLNEEMRENAISPYSFSKSSVTHFLQMLYRSESIPTSVIRVFLAYGPGQNSERFIPQIIESSLQGKLIETSYGEQVRDFCYIDDLVSGVLTALHSPLALGEVFNLASGRGVQIKEVVSNLVGHLGGEVQFGARPYRDGESMYQVADVEKAKAILGWEPSMGLDEGLQLTIDWYKKNVFRR